MKMALKTLSVGELRSPNSTARQHNRHQRKKAHALFSEHGIVVPIKSAKARKKSRLCKRWVKIILPRLTEIN